MNPSSLKNRVILHVDMDAFFASVEQRDRPEWKGKPVIVGAPADRRGVVCAASYEARVFGVRSAMPSRTAKKLCPNGIFVPPDIPRYREEAYLDMTNRCQGVDVEDGLMAALPAAKALKASVHSERGLHISVGIASNKMLAKIASDFDKPNGLTLIPERDKVAFLGNLPVRSIHGVGQVSENILLKAGLTKIRDIQEYPGRLESLLGNFGPALKAFAMGLDDRPVETSEGVKSISSETTFSDDTEDRALLKRALLEQAEEISEKLSRHGLLAKTVQVKVRYSDFTTLSRQTTILDGIQEARIIYRTACQLLAREQLVSRPLRLIGIGASKFITQEREQLILPLIYS
jgi:DNA polymerase-4